MSDLVGPTSHYFYSQRLKLHYVDWGNPTAPAMVLVHGGRDHARNWDWVAARLRTKYHVIAPDLRGHGDSQWAVGGSYSVADYTLDLAQLTEALQLPRLILIGHSLGGSVALHYAATYPERVDKVVAIEGLGPPPSLLVERSAPERMRDWIAEMQALARRHPRRYASLQQAMARMREANPHLTEEQARHLTVHGCYRAEDGTYLWKFDNYVRATSPYLTGMREAQEFWSEIRCPVLLVRGEESWASDPAKDGRATAFRNATVINIPKAGHWVHHDQLDEFLRVVRDFLAQP